MKHATVFMIIALLAILDPWAIALAGAPPPPVTCPQKLSCARARQELIGFRKELLHWKKQLAADQELDAAVDEEAVQQKIAELGRISVCTRCAKRLRSEALQVQSGMDGVVASHYDRWGMKRGEDGRRSFHAGREATRTDPENLAAWISYGKALTAIDGKTMKGRIASFLKIDLTKEMESAATNLRRLLTKAPADASPAQAVLDDLDKRLQK